MDTSSISFESVLHRLADGEMSASERSAFLQECEIKPHQWREVALAFVEAQIIRQELTVFEEDEKPATPPPKPMPKPGPRLLPWLLAACLMVALVWQNGTPQSLTSPITSSPREEQAASPYRLRVADGDLPIYEASQFPEVWQAKVNQLLRDRGYEIDWKTRYITGRLPDGRRLLLPVADPSVHYNGL